MENEKSDFHDTNETMASCAMATGKLESGQYELVRNKIMIFDQKTGEYEECWHIFSQFVPGLPG